MHARSYKPKVNPKNQRDSKRENFAHDRPGSLGSVARSFVWLVGYNFVPMPARHLVMVVGSSNLGRPPDHSRSVLISEDPIPTGKRLNRASRAVARLDALLPFS